MNAKNPEQHPTGACERADGTAVRAFSVSGTPIFQRTPSSEN